MTDKIVLVDVGGLGGLKREWDPYRDSITPIVFEPNLPHADGLRPEIEGRLGGRVVSKALGSEEGHHILNVTRSAGCSSLLVPCSETLSKYSVEVAFEIRHRLIVECSRYDVLMTSEQLPAPDILKIDVQGFEYEVLKGFGESLHQCVAIELEVHLYPLYHGQKLLHDYVDLLGRHGLVLRKLTPVDHFDGYAVEYDAVFSSGPDVVSGLDGRQIRALEIAEAVWELPARRRIFDPQTFDG